MAPKKPEPFNNPFAKLKLPDKAKQAVKPPPPPAPPPRKARPSPDEEDAALFLESVGPVQPVRETAKKAPPPPPRTAAQVSIPSEEAESLARLAELVSGEGPFDLADSDEFIEGAVHGFDERVLRKLRTGAFSFQAHVDLHGQTKDEAKVALEQFISKSRVAGLRCVLVVHGRGLHSKDQIPVLKQSVQVWLSHGRPAKHVLAFCSARPQDGGAGAVYVLLRR
ncbi:MAG: Smr/MutS family protein [Myxococcota bacterium]